MSKEATNIDRFIQLDTDDLHFFTHPHKMQCIALQFSIVLDPVLLCQSLESTIALYPQVGSKIVSFHGAIQFHLDLEATRLRLVVVSPTVILSSADWDHVFKTLRMRAAESGKPRPLFQPLLLRCADPSHGSVLIAGFEHALGDAASYALFLAAWSNEYERLAHCTTLFRSIPQGFPGGMFKADAAAVPAVPGPTDLGVRMRRFILSPAMLAAFRSQLGASGAGLTTNDILLAQCACALAPHRQPGAAAPAGDARPGDAPAGDARIGLLVDRRGRSWEVGRFGNGVLSTSFALPWALLLAGDTAAVAASTATEVRAALHLLFHDPAAAAAAAAERRRLGAPPPIFVWNSWARAGRTLRRAGFGCPGGPARFEWLNALESRDPTTVLVTGVAMPPALPQAPSAPGEALAVLVTCSGAEEEAAVDATWGPAARGGGGGGSPAA